MSDIVLKLANAPIIEAVLDVDCDMPPGQQFATLEKPARDAFRSEYPKLRTVFVQTHQIETKADQPPQMSVQHAIQAFQFLHDDEKQLAQVRAQGFSFNRLAPYTTLDDYLPKIEQAWRLFIFITSPVQIRAVRLRYINRILLPLATNGLVELSDYLKVGPRLPDEKRFTLVGFLDQQTAVEVTTGNRVNIVLTGQPIENDKAPIIFDITAESIIKAEPENWDLLLAQIMSLRALKNHIFKNTLTEQCLNLFQKRP
jgi:uncharacterized protein (TIGR04255 family)